MTTDIKCPYCGTTVLKQVSFRGQFNANHKCQVLSQFRGTRQEHAQPQQAEVVLKELLSKKEKQTK